MSDEELRREVERRVLVEGIGGPRGHMWVRDAITLIVEMVLEERDRCAAVAQRSIDAYPTDIFIEPPAGKHGQTVDACSARAGRHVARIIRNAIRNPPQEPTDERE